MISFLGGAARAARPRRSRFVLPLLALLVFLRTSTSGFSAETATVIDFDIAAGPAVETLKRAAQAGHREIMFPSELGKDVTTQPVKGSYTVIQAITLMLVGTDLTVVADASSDALTIRRTDSSSGKAPTSHHKTDSAVLAPRTPSAAPAEDEIRMGEFTVLGKALSLRRAISDKRKR